MHGFSQMVFVILNGVAMGFSPLVLIGAASFFSYVLFLRRSSRYAWLWATIISLIILAGMLYFSVGKALLEPHANVDGFKAIAPVVKESDLWFGFVAKAIGGLLGIFAGIKFRTHYWPEKQN